MDQRKIPWKAEWKAAGLDPGPLSEAEEALVPQLEAENRAFLERHPPKSVALPRRSGPLFSPWSVSLAVAAAVLVLIALPAGQLSVSASSGERIKGAGDTVLTVYRQKAGKAEKLSPGASVQPGDVLQAAYQVSRPLQGALLSLDGGGNVTVHLAREGRSVALLPGGERPLEFSYELDRAPRYEVFFLFTADRSFELEPLRQILKRTPWDTLRPEAFGKDVRFTVLALTKEVSR